MKVDFLTVLHNRRAVDLYNRHYKVFKKYKNRKIQPVFKVACSKEHESALPEKVEKFKYERIPFQGSLDHAYNLHTLLNQVKTQWFCVIDPDVFPASSIWSESVELMMEKYDFFGAPFPIRRSTPTPHQDFPGSFLAFYKKDIFFKKAKEYGLYNEKNRHWYVFYPLTKKRSLNEVVSKLIVGHKHREHRVYATLNDYVRKHAAVTDVCPDTQNKENGRLLETENIFFNPAGTYDPSFVKREYAASAESKCISKIISSVEEDFQNGLIKLPLSRPWELDEEHLLPYGKKVKDMCERYVKKNNTFVFGLGKRVDIHRGTRGGQGDTTWKTSMMFEDYEVFIFNTHQKHKMFTTDMIILMTQER